MKTKRGLNMCHPLVSLVYLIAVMAFAMVFLHPLYGLLSLLGAFFYAITLKGRKAASFFLRFALPLLAVTVFVNMLVNNEGSTVMFFWPWSKAATLESLLYGLALGVMAVTILLWFFCLNQLFTSEKTQYLLSGFAPSASLLLSMVFRLIPSFEKKTEQIIAGQKGLGRNGQKDVSQKLKGGAVILSALTGWTLETAMETSDSMRARGYGLPGRSRYATYTCHSRDWIIMSILGLLFVLTLLGAIFGEANVTFLPRFSTKVLFPFRSSSYWSYAGLCFFPVILSYWEDIRWHILQWKI